MKIYLSIVCTLWITFPVLQAQEVLLPRDVFELEYAFDPQISPDGDPIVYLRQSMDIMKDRISGKLWEISYNGQYHRPVSSFEGSESQARWSPDGKKLLFVLRNEGKTHLYLRWTDTGQMAKLAEMEGGPGNLTWSQDGEWIAFTRFVETPQEPYISMPAKPKGAEWAAPAKYIDAIRYRNDGGGYSKMGNTQLFVLPALGGTPRQLTDTPYNHAGPLNWTEDGKQIICSANPHADGDYNPRNSEILAISVETGTAQVLTDRKGPDFGPQLSPDGKKLAYLGYEDQYLGYQIATMTLMDVDGGNGKTYLQDFDRNVEGMSWTSDGKGMYLQYSDEGVGKIGFLDLQSGKVQDLVQDVGGTSLGRPYASGSFSVSNNGRLAFTLNSPLYPADVAVWEKGEKMPDRITQLNADLLDHKALGEVDELWFESSFDQRKVQGWLVKPAGFDPSKKYPLILEIHGGPFANYGPRFSAEMQLYAAAGYAVLYINPRGSTSYGAEFGNLIHHNYPGEDYDDLMSGVDAAIETGYIDTDKLYVTGGSGGGVLSSWIIGKTDRFNAAVVAKPVINWYSWAMTADGYMTYYQYWFPGKPWEHQAHYMKRSPISLVGNVTTPTMLLTGEVDYRTPISETEQYYQALKVQKVESAMVRIPEASHGIAAKPSQLITKVLHILKWFDEHP